MSHKYSTHTFVRGKPRPLKMPCACAGCMHLALLAMALLKYFSRSLPTAKDTGIGEVATREANRAVTEEIRCSEAAQTKPPWKRKAYSVFSSEQRAAIGKYALKTATMLPLKSSRATLMDSSTVQTKVLPRAFESKGEYTSGRSCRGEINSQQKKRMPSHSWGH